MCDESQRFRSVCVGLVGTGAYCLAPAAAALLLLLLLMWPQDESLPFKPSAKAAGIDVDSADAAAAAAAAVKGGKGGSKAAAAAAQPDWMPDPKALTKRSKSLVTVLKRLLSRNSAVQGSGPLLKPATTGRRSSAAAAAGPGVQQGPPRPPLPALQLSAQQQQLLSLPPNPAAAAAVAQLAQRLGPGPALLQALQGAAAQGNPTLLTEYLRQQQVAAQQIRVQQQQQQQAGGSVLGKRSAAAAGLNEGAAPSLVVPAAGAAAGGGGGGGGGVSPDGVLVLARGLPLVQRDASGGPVLPLVLSKDLMVIALGR